VTSINTYCLRASRGVHARMRAHVCARVHACMRASVQVRARGRPGWSPLLESLMAPEASNPRCTLASTVDVLGCVAICSPWYRVPCGVRTHRAPAVLSRLQRCMVDGAQWGGRAREHAFASTRQGFAACARATTPPCSALRPRHSVGCNVRILSSSAAGP